MPVVMLRCGARPPAEYPRCIRAVTTCAYVWLRRAKKRRSKHTRERSAVLGERGLMRAPIGASRRAALPRDALRASARINDVRDCLFRDKEQQQEPCEH